MRETNVFSALGLSLLQRVVRGAMLRTSQRALVEAVVVFASSIQVLDGLLCRDFAASSRRYAPDPARFDLDFGRVDGEAAAVG